MKEEEKKEENNASCGFDFYLPKIYTNVSSPIGKMT